MKSLNEKARVPRLSTAIRVFTFQISAKCDNEQVSQRRVARHTRIMQRIIQRTVASRRATSLYLDLCICITMESNRRENGGERSCEKKRATLLSSFSPMYYNDNDTSR